MPKPFTQKDVRKAYSLLLVCNASKEVLLGARAMRDLIIVGMKLRRKKRSDDQCRCVKPFFTNHPSAKKQICLRCGGTMASKDK
jgi:hypothetical protein